MNKFLKEFKDRGFFYQCTSEDELSKKLDEEKIKGYIGFDCTAESLHIGSLLQIMCLRLLQKNGHQPMANEDKTVYISFNGEIYNAFQLKNELIDSNYNFDLYSVF